MPPSSFLPAARGALRRREAMFHCARLELTDFPATALGPFNSEEHKQMDANSYVIADLNLADWGRKEIQIAEVEMPG